MPTFTYKAIDNDGKAVTGVLQAESQGVALRQLGEQALFPVSIAEGGGAVRSSISGRKRRVKLRHQTGFYSQLADLLRAGVPLLRALDVLARQSGSPVLSEVIREVREHVAGGNTLADAMEMHPNAFAPLHVATIRAGEAGGFLEDVLTRLATFAERQDELRNKLLGSIIYPCVLMFAGAAVVTLLMVFVVPTLRKHLREDTFNVLSHAVFGVSDFITGWYPVLLVGGGALLMGVLAYLRTESGRTAFDRFKLKAPVVGKIVTMVGVCRFCRVLGSLLQNGVPILQALDISRESAGNRILAAAIKNAADNVQKGETLSKPLGSCGLFPPDVIDMMAVAEESNNLDNVLTHVAETNEARTARLIDLAVRLIEPTLLLVMALVVLCIALALLLPILTMASKGIGR
jgi:type II secretory pathway component PulF